MLFLLDHVRRNMKQNVSIQSGDEMSKRTKFLFVTWLGPNVGTMKRARLSSDKALVKEIIMVNLRTTYDIVSIWTWIMSWM